jgi:tight adherence protein B
MSAPNFFRHPSGRCNPGGWVVLAVGATACLVAYRLMVRLGRLPEDARVLP